MITVYPSISPTSNECSKKELSNYALMGMKQRADSVEFKHDFWIPSSLKPELNPMEYEKKVEETELSIATERHFKNGRACKRSNTYSGKLKKASRERLRRNTVIGNEISPILINPSIFKNTEKKADSQETLTNEPIAKAPKKKFSLFKLFTRRKKEKPVDKLPYSSESNIVEKKLYISSHSKLMDSNRPLAQQVLISNLIIKILNTNAHLNTPLPKIEPKKSIKPRRRHSLQHQKRIIKPGRRSSDSWKFNIVDHFLSEEDDHVPLYQLKTNNSS